VGTPIVGLDSFDSAAALRCSGRAMEGVTFATFGYPDPGSELDEFYERYRAAYGRRPDGSAAALGYQAIRVLEAAINKCESTAPGSLRRALRGAEVGGPLPLSYPERRGAVPRVEIALVTVHDGRFELVARRLPEDR
jgi:branched-chain amino acid transport system substrate-binding protein